jgi:hypothetical protein
VLIEILCDTPEELKQALLTQQPLTYVYLRVNKRDVETLTFNETKSAVSVSFRDVKSNTWNYTTFFKPEANLQTIFNKRRTKVSITVTGSKRETTKV